ncbi:hypothetical protein LAV84_25750 [Rhizobium sp. VS19-DR104.2]|uniref:DUF707 domain-containing protein n=1 Tax=unclassified Rhizobium TaxID=2613769 RepID=UPI001CC66772|nr:MULTISPECIES: DUF707 domain-containing protein [unclassified Rhizobium]MBZ5762950.1 hypothetical protein [Rhizobium sp. VS19-DR96]MBZ5768783.1 hypothetical protein [Rhizobium sp. VS19-DR129.2]MBZ5776399.1 hypothetical protein [Rhizobium sp. VS19-DRK62.2]MBZ5787606.1 hypothetical protein [Rhizobium sp. VS19-DR121]MBZ5804961.1 hypothetical protein [Rhizobium sp. VS19-DR181]
MAPVLAPTLAVVRCGDQSLHGSWCGEGRQFDVAVSYFGSDETKLFPEANYVHRGKGGKWDGIYGFFKEHPETLTIYEYFWFPDDDIRATTSDVNRLFAAGRSHGLLVYQPSLDRNSYYSHLITLQHPSFDLRYSNFVEIMVPVLSRAILAETLESLKDSKSGFGMDFVWPKLAVELSGKLESVAILDSVTVCHTRPVGGKLHQLIKKVGGNTANDDLVSTLGRTRMKRDSLINGVAVPRIRVLSGVDISGVHLSGPRLSMRIAGDLIGRYRNAVQPVYLTAAVRHALKSLTLPIAAPGQPMASEPS